MRCLPRSMDGWRSKAPTDNEDRRPTPWPGKTRVQNNIENGGQKDGPSLRFFLVLAPLWVDVLETHFQTHEKHDTQKKRTWLNNGFPNEFESMPQRFHKQSQRTKTPLEKQMVFQRGYHHQRITPAGAPSMFTHRSEPPKSELQVIDKLCQNNHQHPWKNHTKSMLEKGGKRRNWKEKWAEKESEQREHGGTNVTEKRCEQISFTNIPKANFEKSPVLSFLSKDRYPAWTLSCVEMGQCPHHSSRVPVTPRSKGAAGLSCEADNDGSPANNHLDLRCCDSDSVDTILHNTQKENGRVKFVNGNEHVRGEWKASFFLFWVLLEYFLIFFFPSRLLCSLAKFQEVMLAVFCEHLIKKISTRRHGTILYIYCLVFRFW